MLQTTAMTPLDNLVLPRTALLLLNVCQKTEKGFQHVLILFCDLKLLVFNPFTFRVKFSVASCERQTISILPLHEEIKLVVLEFCVHYSFCN